MMPEVVLSYGLEDFGDDRRKFKHLAIYSGDPDHPIEASMGEWLREVLNCFRNLQDLTIVTKYHCNNHIAKLVYLEKKEVLEAPGYAAQCTFHPLLFKEFPRLESEWHLWADSDWILKRAPYYELGRFKSKKNRGYKAPSIQCKPVVPLRGKLHFLERKQQYDRRRNAQKVSIIWTAEGYNSLEVSVPLLTTMEDLTVTFCRVRNIEDVKPRGEHKIWMYYGNPLKGHGELELEDAVFGLIGFGRNMLNSGPFDEPQRIDLFFQASLAKRSICCQVGDSRCEHNLQYIRRLGWRAKIGD